MASDHKYLPTDILVDLFCRLGVESLIRSSSVCKTWYHIIRTTSFAKSHLTYQKTSSNTNKYILHQDSKSCTLLTSIDPLFDGTKYSKLNYSPGSFERDIDTRDGCELRIHGICDGLLCISTINGISDHNNYLCRRYYHVGDNLHLWNPICRKAKKLPELKITWFNRELGGVSFGYYDNDYKVIVITCVDRTFVVSVYSLTSNCWNIINTDSYYEDDKIVDFCIMQPTKFVDGIAYMIASFRTHSAYKTHMAICFDLRDETIYQFKCPKEFDPDRYQFTMEAYGETIAVWGRDDSNPGWGCDANLSMWVLLIDEFSSKSRWEKKLVIEMHRHELSIPVGFLYNGKYLVRTTLYFEGAADADFFLYDLNSLEVIKKYGSLEDYPDSVCRIDADCVESLLLLNEHSVNPIVHKEIESCSSKLFTLLNTLHKKSPIEVQDERKQKKPKKRGKNERKQKKSKKRGQEG